MSLLGETPIPSPSMRRLEIGPGERPIPGFESLNIEPNGFSEHIADASGPLPFDDNIFETIYASHVLEHIPWYMTEVVLQEWIRVLQPKGTLEIWVPDGLKIANTLVAYECQGKDLTGLDNWYRFNPDRDVCRWASGRIFTYGDGTGDRHHWNWHRALFTPRFLRSLLEKLGLENVRLLNGNEVRGHDHGWISLGMCGTKPTTSESTACLPSRDVTPAPPSSAPPAVAHIFPEPTQRAALKYRSLDDMSRLISEQVWKFSDFDVFVGIPRSGMLAATLIALHVNAPVVSLDQFLVRELSQLRTTRRGSRHKDFANNERPRVLVVDDSSGSGSTIMKSKRDIMLAGMDEYFDIHYFAAFSSPQSSNFLGLWLEIVEQPRIFEWNLFHHNGFSERTCWDMDGVLCDDPTDAENDDGERYISFLNNARLRLMPTMKIGAVVTSRLEKYRPQTEAWLKDHNIQYHELIMLNLPSAEERRRLGVHAWFKSEVYKASQCVLFIESDPRQAEEIWRRTGRAVFSVGNRTMYGAS